MPTVTQSASHMESTPGFCYTVIERSFVPYFRSSKCYVARAGLVIQKVTGANINTMNSRIQVILKYYRAVPNSEIIKSYAHSTL